MIRSLKKIWCRLSVVTQVLYVSAILALVLTIFFGLISSQEVIRAWSQWFSPWPFGLLDWLTNTLILTVVGVGIVRLVNWVWSRRQHPDEDNSTESTKYRLLDDVPVDRDEDDEFERENFVKTLSRTIVLPPNANSLVLALEAPWGAGKSSVLTLLVREIEEHPDNPLIVRFNPWLATGRDRIFRAFFSQFSAALLDEGERDLASSLVNFGEALEDLLPARARIFPRLGFNRLRRLVGQIPVINLEGEQDHLCDAVTETGRPIVVLIDDIDRLAPKDIRVVFQLVKAIAAFPRVAYLLAFDPEPIDRALAFGAEQDKGRQFRDKIVQANIALPRIRYRTRKRYFSIQLQERLKAWQFTLDHRGQQLLDKSIPLVLAALRTPRDMKRVLNKTLLTADNVRKEVNFADVLVFETLHAKYPEIAENIRLNPQVVDPMGYGDEEHTGGEIAAMVRQEMDEKKDKSAKLDEFVSVYPQDRAVPASLLRFTFPPIFVESPEPEDSDYAGDRRIALHENLLKLLYQGLHGEILSADEAAAFLGEESGREAFLADVLEARSLPAWLGHLRQFVSSTTIPAPGELMRKIALAVNSLYEQARIDVTNDARWLLLDILKSVPESEREDVLANLFGEPPTASVGEELLTSLLRDSGLWENGQYFGIDELRPNARQEYKAPTPDQLVRLKELWLSTIRNMGIRKILKTYPNAGGVLFRWGQLAQPPYQEVASELDSALEDSDLTRSFVDQFPPGISLDGTENFVLGTAWDKLREFFETADVPESTKNRFIEHYGNRSFIESDPNPKNNHPDESD